MKPILYPENETAFDTNGIGVLADAISCVSNHALNGQYEITLKYPITGIHFKEIAQRSIILAKSEPDKDPQPFRVYHITKPTISGIVTAYARHITYDLIGTPVSPFTADSAADALVQMKSNAVTDCPFSFYTDKSTAATMTVSVPTSAWTLLGGSEGSILDTYGGEYEFDRWNVNLLNRRGADRGVSIRYGKNLTSLVQDENCANCYTGVYPYWASIDGTELVQLPEKILDAPGTYSYVRILTLDLSEEWMEAPTEEQLRSRAQAYMTANSIGVPTVSWKIEFVQLEQTEEYKHLGSLEQVLLGDTVSVIFADMGVNASARVVEVEYDSLLERYKSVTLGSVKANLATTIAAQNKEIAKKPTKTYLQKAVSEATAWLTNGKGYKVERVDANGNTVDTLYLDTPDINTAVNVLRIGQSGIGFSRSGVEGPYYSAWTLDGTFFADWILAGTLRAAGIDLTGAFTVKTENDDENSGDGYRVGGRLGFMAGMTAAGEVTDGIGMSNADGSIFAIVTEAGASLNAGAAVVNVTKAGRCTVVADVLNLLGKHAMWQDNGDGTCTLIGT